MRLTPLLTIALLTPLLSQASPRPNVLFTPHMAFNSVEAVERILQTTVDNIRAFIDGAPINVVSVEEAARS